MADRAQRSQDAKRAARASREPLQQLWTPPPSTECHDANEEIYLDEANRIRIRRRTWREQLVDFAVVHIHLEDIGWIEMASIDCCHGYVHRHDEGHGKRSAILAIQSQLDVQRSINPAFDEVYSRYVRRI
jgi:hypothetical protein